MIKGNCQPPSTAAGYDIARMRLLIQTSGINIFAVNQGLIDMDSAMFLVCRAQRKQTSFWYEEGYNFDDAGLPGRTLVDKGNIPAALALLPGLQDRDRILLYLQLGAWHLFKPGADPAMLQKAAGFFRQAEELSRRANEQKLHEESLTMLARYNSQAGNDSAAGRLISLVVSAAEKTGNKKELADALFNKGRILSFRNPEKEGPLQSALTLYKELGNIPRSIEVLNELINLHFIYAKPGLATDELLQTIDLKRSIGFRHIQYAQCALSYMYSLKNDYANTLRYAEDAVAAMQATGDTAFAASFYIILGNAYGLLGRRDEAIAIYRKAAETPSPMFRYKALIAASELLAHELKYQQAVDLILQVKTNYPPLNALDRMLIFRELGDIWWWLNKPAQAKNFYREAVAVADSIHVPQLLRDVATVYANVAYFYAHTHQLDSARPYFAKVLAIPAAIRPANANLHILNIQYLIDSADGNYLAAIRSYEQYVHLWDQTTLKDMDAKYQSSLKEQNIRLLENQAKLQESRLSQANFRQNMTLGIIVLLLVIVGLIYYQYRVNRRNNRVTLEKNEMLRHLVEEKEWLLKEVHHRVKNNLYMITSLLESQSAYAEEGALPAILDSQNRVHAMSLIHQKLYQREGVTSIDMSAYIHELVNYLTISLNARHRIRFVVDTKPVELDVTQAIPLGLILNEAITNSVKYAFPATIDSPVVRISLLPARDESMILIVEDNGIGLQPGFELKQKTSLGLTLITGLSEEINSEFTISGDGGTTISIRFAANSLPRPPHHS